MARPDGRRQQRRRVPLLLATLAVCAAVAGAYFARPVAAQWPDKPADVPVHPPKPAPARVGPVTVATPGANDPFPMPPELEGVDLLKQTKEDADGKSAGCISCHQGVQDMHYKATVRLGCTDCHGGDAHKDFPEPGSTRYCPAAPPSRNPSAWRSSANPVRSYTLLNHEDPEFIRFVNPGDLRIAHISCGTTNCHPKEVLYNHKSMMTHGCMLWGAALYNNGSIPNKRARFGEAYSMTGVPLRLQTVPPPSAWEMKHRGVIPFLDPLPRFEISQSGNVLRIFERGGAFRIEVGVPEDLPAPTALAPAAESPGRPISSKLSNRGLGTENRTDPVMVGLQKTRLFDPGLNFIGTTDHAGDYRHSGCTACHVIYANDRSPIHSGPYAKYGHRGLGYDKDPMIPKDEPGHPIEHRFAKGNAIPTSQCMVCHVHPGTNVMNSYIGYMWWDCETDAPKMYPPQGKHLTAQQGLAQSMNDPNEISYRGNWSDPAFLDSLYDKNPEMEHNYFGDFHSHGWVFSAVFKMDKKGNYLDYFNNKVEDFSAANRMKSMQIPLEVKAIYGLAPEKRAAAEKKVEQMRHGVAQHLLDIHMEKGMHCIDCHFVQDNHGNGRLQMEVRAAIEIQCIDCHGTVTRAASLHTTGPAAYTSTPGKPALGRNLAAMRTPSGKPRFERKGGKVYQNSMVEPNLTWEVVQTKDTINPASEHYNQKAALAKTIHREGDKLVWGTVPPPTKAGVEDSGCAHSNKNMTCITCHSSWNPSCYGCHLPQRANVKMPQLHNEGDVTKNYTAYNWQTLRSDVFMLARDGDATGNRINPARSSCAIHVSSFNGLREQIYVQQQTHSAEGLSGIAFSTNVPHTVSGKNSTKMCTDCHLSNKDDNNATMAQLLMQGTGYVNFMGRFCWVAAGEHGVFGPVVTELQEPQAVIGSYLHKHAFPEEFEEHEHRGKILKEAREHPCRDILENITHPFTKVNVLAVQNRGEYMYCACGENGVKLLDISFADHKGFSEKIFTGPVSPMGQQFYIRTAYATSLAAPSTVAPDPTRKHYPTNEEPSVAGIYGSLFITDKYEGLIVVGAATLLDGNPLNNFVKRDLTYNPDGLLCGARAISIIGTYGYISCNKGVVVLQLADPVKPVVKAVIGHKYLKHPTCVAAQFRYAYISDEEGVKVFDITDPENPKPVSKIKIPHVHNIYMARTYAYLAAGKLGLVILDIENPENPKVDQIYNADGCINDLHDVKLAASYPSEFAYLADGRNGMRIVQLTSPETPGLMGFSPRPHPELIATYPIPHHGHALAVCRALDRDRAIDESGNQIGVFGRVGARPLNVEEQKKMYLYKGKPWKVSNDPFDPVYSPIKSVRPVPTGDGNGGGPKLPPK